MAAGAGNCAPPAFDVWLPPWAATRAFPAALPSSAGRSAGRGLARRHAAQHRSACGLPRVDVGCGPHAQQPGQAAVARQRTPPRSDPAPAGGRAGRSRGPHRSRRVGRVRDPRAAPGARPRERGASHVRPEPRSGSGRGRRARRLGRRAPARGSGRDHGGGLPSGGPRRYGAVHTGRGPARRWQPRPAARRHLRGRWRCAVLPHGRRGRRPVVVDGRPRRGRRARLVCREPGGRQGHQHEEVHPPREVRRRRSRHPGGW